MDQITAKKIIDKTRDDYNLIADQFASTRKFNWSDTTQPINEMGLKEEDKVLDLGCGNGRLYELLRNYQIDYYGIDISDKLVDIAKENVPNGHFLTGDILENPYEDNFFDAVISIAVIHHIPTKILRKQAVKEIHRVTRPGGKIMITAWYFWETKRYLKLIDGYHDDVQEYGDFLMPWKNGPGETITKRYFHAWRITELEDMLKDIGFINIHVRQSKKSSGLPGYNIVATAQKPL